MEASLSYKPLYICCDGSKRGIGGYLFQKINGEERVISYFSRATTKDERKWDTRELEVLAMISTLEYFRPYIDGQVIHVDTDHRNLTWLSRLRGRSDRLGRWVLRLSEFQAKVSWRKGQYMHVADCMSRNSINGAPEATDDSDDVHEAASAYTAYRDAMITELNPSDGGFAPDNHCTVSSAGLVTRARIHAVFRIDISMPTRDQRVFERAEQIRTDRAAQASHGLRVEVD